jgi:hypothetical protein
LKATLPITWAEILLLDNCIGLIKRGFRHDNIVFQSCDVILEQGDPLLVWRLIALIFALAEGSQ